jgi:transposase-like protein
VSKLSSLEELFAGRHFDREVIILCARWYLRYKLSFRDLVEMMAERGLDLAHTTILRWVRRLPLLKEIAPPTQSAKRQLDLF